MRFRSSVALALLAACASWSSAATLRVGDKAPALKVGKWVQGDPVSNLDEGKVYVVEFWATWCGPCKATIPHLNEMSKTYKDVTFIGQDVWENEADSSLVEPFVKEMGDKMTYRVAIDDRADGGKGAMAETWMDAAGRDSIPTAFIVNKSGTVAWIGHPMELEPVLKTVVDGTYDLDKAKAKAKIDAGKEDQAKAIQQELQSKLGPLLTNKDYAGAATALDEIVAAHPEQKAELLGVKFGIQLAGKNYDDAYKTADDLAAANNDDAQKLNQLAWTIVDSKKIEKKDFARAEKYATRAAEITQNKEPNILDTLARTHAEQGHYDKAIEIETKAIDAADDAKLKAELQKTLDGYKAKLAK